MIIRNYGRLWKKSAVNWGDSRQQGDLLAIGERNKGGADFREQVAVYILHGPDLQPVYVGHTGKGKTKLLGRLRAHAHNPRMANRWEFFSWFGFRRAEPDGMLADIQKTTKLDFVTALHQLEAVLIYALEPKLNGQSGLWGEAEEYFQMATQEQWGFSHDDIVAEVNDLKERIEELTRVMKGKPRTSASMLRATARK